MHKNEVSILCEVCLFASCGKCGDSPQNFHSFKRTEFSKKTLLLIKTNTQSMGPTLAESQWKRAHFDALQSARDAGCAAAKINFLCVLSTFSKNWMWHVFFILLCHLHVCHKEENWCKKASRENKPFGMKRENFVSISWLSCQLFWIFSLCTVLGMTF